MTYVVGIDIGGTKIATGLLTDSGELIAKTEIPSDPTDREKMYAQVVLGVERLLTQASIQLSDIAAIGVGVPGKVDTVNGIAVYQNNLPWESFPLAARLRDTFAIDKISVENDAVMATFAEWAEVCGHLEETFVYMTVSTGISCQTIHRGELIRGRGFAGEIGLLPVFTGQSTLKRLEQVSSGPALQRASQRIWGSDQLQTRDLFEKYVAGETEATQLVHEMVEGIAQGVYTVISLIDPHKIVIGGGVLNHQPLLLEKVKETLQPYLIDAQADVLHRFSLSVLKGDAGVIGAGIVANRSCE